MIITFLSDFGSEDGYAGSVKGVLLSKAPQAVVVDISHDIPPFNVKRAAYTLLNYYDSFPAGTVHLAVIDPGVGSARKALILQCARYYFVGPDNGLFSLLQKRESCQMWQILPEKVNPNLTNATFHGRDLFGPAAAMLAMGTKPEQIARPLGEKPLSETPFLDLQGNICSAHILAIDHFGNIVSALHRDDLKRWKKSIKLVTFKNYRTTRLRKFYAEVPKGNPLALWNSLNFLEIALREGRAADFFKVDAQKDRVLIELTD